MDKQQVPTYSTGNYVQQPVINHNGKGKERKKKTIKKPPTRMHNFVPQAKHSYSIGFFLIFIYLAASGVSYGM